MTAVELLESDPLKCSRSKPQVSSVSDCHRSLVAAAHTLHLHCIALYSSIVLYCIALHCIALYCIALDCIGLHWIGLHCVALHWIALHCIALPRSRRSSKQYGAGFCVEEERSIEQRAQKHTAF